MNQQKKAEKHRKKKMYGGNRRKKHKKALCWVKEAHATPKLALACSEGAYVTQKQAYAPNLKYETLTGARHSL
jgi:hypothetical protein